MDLGFGHTDYESVEPEVLLTSKLKNLKRFSFIESLYIPDTEPAPNFGSASRLTEWGRVRGLKSSL